MLTVGGAHPVEALKAAANGAADALVFPEADQRGPFVSCAAGALEMCMPDNPSVDLRTGLRARDFGLLALGALAGVVLLKAV